MDNLNKFYKANRTFKAVKEGVVYLVVMFDRRTGDMGLRDKTHYELVIQDGDLNKKNFTEVSGYDD